MNYDLANGKYTVVYDEKSGLINHVLRHKEPWREVIGDNLIHHMMWRILELEERLKGVNA